MPVVVDTDVVSYVFKRDSRARAYRRFLVGQVMVISFMTLAELMSWSVQRKWGLARKQQLASFLSQFVVSESHRSICEHWAEIDARARRQGRPIACADCWIAATALVLGVPLVTNNADDYAEVNDLRILTVQS